MCEFMTTAMGKRYRRQDEIGTPYCVTIDFDTIGAGDDASLADTVTVRDRDTMVQERVKIAELQKYFQENLFR
jgi:glycyl-tRNA synthetase